MSACQQNELTFDQLMKKSEKVNFERKIQTTYDAADLIYKLVVQYRNKTNTAFSRSATSIEEIRKAYAIEYLRRYNDQYCYTVFKTEQGGKLFIIFVKDDSDEQFYYHSYIYFTKIFSLSELQSIHQGDEISKVFEMESATQCYASIVEPIIQRINEDIVYLRLVTDNGLYTVGYSVQTKLVDSVSKSKDELIPQVLDLFA